MPSCTYSCSLAPICPREQHRMFRPWAVCRSRPKITWITATEHFKVKKISQSQLFCFGLYNYLVSQVSFYLQMWVEQCPFLKKHEEMQLLISHQVYSPTKGHLILIFVSLCVFNEQLCLSNFTMIWGSLLIARGSLANYSLKREWARCHVQKLWSIT